MRGTGVAYLFSALVAVCVRFVGATAAAVYGRRPGVGRMMVETQRQQEKPFRLIVTGEANAWLPALETIVGPRWIAPHRVNNDRELLDVVEARQADAAVLDDQVDWALDILRILRLIRRLDTTLPVVVVTHHRDRRRLQAMLELRAYSVVGHPLELEQLLRQIHGMMLQMNRMLREGDPGVG